MLLRGVLAGAFAKRRGVAFRVENVVGDLKRRADRAPIGRERRARRRVSAGKPRPGLDAESEQRAGLHRLQLRDRRRPKAAPSTAPRRCRASARRPSRQGRWRAQGPHRGRRARRRLHRSQDRPVFRKPKPAARRRRESPSLRRRRGEWTGARASGRRRPSPANRHGSTNRRGRIRSRRLRALDPCRRVRAPSPSPR